MGKVFSSESIRNGTIPAPDGSSQFNTAREIHSHLQEADRFISNVVIFSQGYGSTTTGNAGRRGDVDYVIGVGYSPDKQVARRTGKLETIERPESESAFVELQLVIESLKKMCRTVADRYYTHPEIQYFSIADARDGTADITKDPLYLDHIFKSPIGFRVGDLQRFLGGYEIDITEEMSAEQVNRVVSVVLQYMTNRARYFLGGANEFSGITFDTWKLRERVICDVLQRALESAKGAARKAMAVGAIQGISAEGADVTNKSSMYQQFERLTEIAGRHGVIMLDRHRWLAEKNREYDEVSEAAIASGETGEYERWIQRSLFETLMKAYELAAACHKFVDDLTYSNFKYKGKGKGKGIVLDDAHDDELYRLVLPGDSVDFSSDSSSAPLLDDHPQLGEPQTFGRESLVRALR